MKTILEKNETKYFTFAQPPDELILESGENSYRVGGTVQFGLKMWSSVSTHNFLNIFWVLGLMPNMGKLVSMCLVAPDGVA